MIFNYDLFNGVINIIKNSFSRIITLLRKEKKLSQKKVAQDLEISQALLSHYEKGIRECKLDFVVKVADYYNVSIDYLLGRAPERNGLVLTVDDIPADDENNQDKRFHGNILATLNKKLILNSMNIIFDVLQKINSKALINAVSEYLLVSVYKMFRVIFSANENNPSSFFSLNKDMYMGLTSAAQNVAEAKAMCLTNGHKVDNTNGLTKSQKEAICLAPEDISHNYPLFSSSICNLIKNVEKEISNK